MQNPSDVDCDPCKLQHGQDILGVNTRGGKGGKPCGKPPSTGSSLGSSASTLFLSSSTGSSQTFSCLKKNISFNNVLGGLPPETLIVLGQFSGCLGSNNLSIWTTVEVTVDWAFTATAAYLVLSTTTAAYPEIHLYYSLLDGLADGGVEAFLMFLPLYTRIERTKSRCLWRWLTVANT